MLFRIDARPNRWTTWTVSWFLFAAGISLYFYTANARHIENPEDKVVPNLRQLGQGMTDAFLKPDSEQEAVPDMENASLPKKFYHIMMWGDKV